jgi:hypothetical protein
LHLSRLNLHFFTLFTVDPFHSSDLIDLVEARLGNSKIESPNAIKSSNSEGKKQETEQGKYVVHYALLLFMCNCGWFLSFNFSLLLSTHISNAVPSSNPFPSPTRELPYRSSAISAAASACVPSLCNNSSR